MKQEFDCIVIGAGVLGSAVASELAESGRSVLILERDVPASGASGGNVGQTSVSDRSESWHLKLAVDSLRYYREELSKEYDIGYFENGGSILLTGETQIRAAEQAVSEMNRQGVEAYVLRGEEIFRKEPALSPEGVEAVLYCPLEGGINPFYTTLAFLDKAKRAGAVLLQHTAVTGFVMDGKRITAVQTEQGDFRAEWILNCAGPQSGLIAEMAGVSIPIRFHKGTAFVSQPIAPLINGPVNDGFFLVPSEGPRPKRAISFGTVQSAEGSVLIAQSTEECEMGDKSVNMPSLQAVAQGFLKHFPQLQDLPILRAWAAITTYTDDHLPVFGPSQGAENLFTVAGFKGAFTTAPAVAKLTLRTLQGQADPAYACCSPDR